MNKLEKLEMMMEELDNNKKPFKDKKFERCLKHPKINQNLCQYNI